MIDLVIFFSFFYVCLISVLGYGKIFVKIFINNVSVKEDINILIGFYGLMFLTLISLLTSFFFKHNFFHNIIIHCIGVFYFFYLPVFKNLNYFKHIIYISIFLIPILLISKTHDDFSFYHFPFTKFLTENHIIFGMGNINVGYNFLSSLFFLNSTFYLPLIKLYSFHFSIIFFLLFFNYFLLVKIFSLKTDEFFKYLYFLTFIFFNLSFNRLAEFGMDKGGQLLIVLLIIKLFENITQNKNQNKIDNILLLLPLLGFCISTKTYFLTYLILGLSILLVGKNYFKNLKYIIFSKSFLSFVLILILIFSHHFISTGCLISPLPYLCFGQNFDWARNLTEVKELSIWVEQWSKAGASPTYVINDGENYIKNFNWLLNWINEYFLIKFLDQIAILFSAIILILLSLKKFQISKKKFIFKKKFLLFFSLICVIFYIWFVKHPTLRYGGYSIFFLIVSFPFAILFYKLQNRNHEKNKMVIIIALVVFLVDFKNLIRINKEFQRNDHYNFKNFPFFAIKAKDYTKKNFKSGLTIYSAHHCWDTPSPCGSFADNTETYYKNGYYFIKILN